MRSFRCWRICLFAVALPAVVLGVDPVLRSLTLPARQEGARAEPLSPFQLPAGFVIEKVAGPPLVEHPMMAGFDERGRLFIAESAGQNLKAADLVKQLPNFIRVLDPADEAGRFRTGRIFADKMTFPMGVLWHDGALYTCSSGALWKLEDTKNAGVADKRTELVKKFGFTGNAADVHGPFLGPDGRLYWCEGRHGHEIERPDGTVMKGKAARIFRCRPDGTDLEVVCGGGMDNPVEIAFTPEGEPFATVNILHNRPARNDGIIYAIEGGVWPWHEAYKEFPRTGDLLPAAADLGWVAPSGLMRYRSETFGKEYRDNLFSAQFNRSRIQRHIVERDGAGFKIKSEDFLVSSDKNFHPTDVLEDADGSLLVIDTGGWFRIGCPTSKIAQPDIKGAIYRIRKKDAKPVADARGLKLDWGKSVSHYALTERLDDPRWAVRDRAVHTLAKTGAVLPLDNVLSRSSARASRNAVWTLLRNGSPTAAVYIRTALSNSDLSVRLAAVHALGLTRDEQALPQLLNHLDKGAHPALRRATATALGRIGKGAAVRALMDAVPDAKDRYLEHALIFALIQIGDREATTKYLRQGEPAVRRAALIALDQMPGGRLRREEVTPLLGTQDPALLKTALAVIAERPDWAPEIVGLLRDWLEKPRLDAAQRESVRGLLLGLSNDHDIQRLVERTLRRTKTDVDTRLLLLDTMARVPLAQWPAGWECELASATVHADERVVRQAVETIRAARVSELAAGLLELTREPQRSLDIRLSAFAAAAPQVTKLDAELFAFVRAQLDKHKPPLVRLAAANALGQTRLDAAQLKSLASAVAAAGPLELPGLLSAFEKSKDAEVGAALAAALDKGTALASLSPAVIERTFKSYPPEVRRSADRLIQRLEAAMLKERERLAELEPLLTGGDAGRGQLIFYGVKATCSACHTVAKAGGNLGPDLTKIGAVRSGRDLLEALIFPSASFARGYEPYIVETRGGQVLTGILTNETPDALTLGTTDRAELRIPRDQIEVFVPGRVSIMPQGLDSQLSRDELRDLLAYLQSLR